MRMTVKRVSKRLSLKRLKHLKLLNSNDELRGDTYVGLHFQPGVAEYSDKPGMDGKPLRIYIDEVTAKRMDPTFSGCPVFVNHKDGITKADENKVAGWVQRSFYNRFDGNHWVEFVITSDEGKQAIKNGYRLSNCYKNLKRGKPGVWHGVSYDEQIMGGEYEHLALVKSPRYDESIILNSKEFKEYNSIKENQLFKLANSKDNRRKSARRKLYQINNSVESGLNNKSKVRNKSKTSRDSLRMPVSSNKRIIKLKRV